MPEQQNAHVLDHDAAKVVVHSFPSRAEWIRARRAVITSTDIAPLAGVGKFGSALSVYTEKMRAPSDEDGVDDSGSTRMLLGRLFQRDIALGYQLVRSKETGEHVGVIDVPDNTLFVHATNASHGTSLDSFQHNGKELQSILEIKMSTAYPEEPYDDWLCQVQWQMYVTGKAQGTIAALCGGDLRWWDIARDDDMIGDLRNAADSFLEKCILPKMPPPSDGSDASRRAMKRLYPVSDGTEIEMALEDLDRVVKINDLERNIAILDQEAELHRDALKQKMGGASVAFLPNGGQITWKSYPRKGYVVQPSIVRPFKIQAEPKERKS